MKFTHQALGILTIVCGLYSGQAAMAATGAVTASLTVGSGCTLSGATNGTLGFPADRGTVSAAAAYGATRASFSLSGTAGSMFSVVVTKPVLTIDGVVQTQSTITLATNYVYNVATGGTAQWVNGSGITFVGTGAPITWYVEPVITDSAKFLSSGVYVVSYSVSCV